jgi:UDP-N-acetylglucosamine 4,6-dehydratase/5-epimerase
VKTFVSLSTDKAVKPVSAMGTSKAMMEKIVCSQNLYDRSTIFCCVRYGNVMGSRGSVIPLFRSQIERDVPLTVTVPGMTRFLMTLDESVELVHRALTEARGGEIFVRKAPASTVAALARAMCVKYSPRGEDHPIVVTGIRPGEKLHEVLVNEYEMQRVREDGDYFVIYPEYRADRELTPQRLGFEYTSEHTTQVSGAGEIGQLLDAMGDCRGYI